MDSEELNEMDFLCVFFKFRNQLRQEDKSDVTERELKQGFVNQ